MRDLIVQPLPADRLPLVYPLVRAVMPSVTLEAWLRYGRRLLAPRQSAQSGIVAATRQARSLPCGMFCWRREQDPEKGAIIVAEHFVAMDILDSHPMHEALVAELERMGRELGCAAVRSVIHDDSPETKNEFLAAGHRTTAALLSKDLHPQPPYADTVAAT